MEKKKWLYIFNFGKEISIRKMFKIFRPKLQ